MLFTGVRFFSDNRAHIEAGLIHRDAFHLRREF